MHKESSVICQGLVDTNAVKVKFLCPLESYLTPAWGVPNPLLTQWPTGHLWMPGWITKTHSWNPLLTQWPSFQEFSEKPIIRNFRKNFESGSISIWNAGFSWINLENFLILHRDMWCVYILTYLLIKRLHTYIL